MKLSDLFIFTIAIAFGCERQTKIRNTEPVIQKRFKNTLINKEFETEQLIGLTEDKKNHQLHSFRKGGKWAGNTINFLDSVHFISAYKAWCGNDCFTSVYGRYYFVDHHTVRFFTDSIRRDGDCEAPTVYTRSRPPLDFSLVKMPDGQLQLKYSEHK